MAYHAGIDLGTTYTAAATHRDGRVEVVSLGDRSTVIPSVLFLRAEGDVLTGDPANRRGVQEPDRVAREFKRRVGDPAPVYLGGTPLAPHVLLARLLRATVDRVAELEGEYPSVLAITHPANWGPYKLDLLRQAVEHAGFGGYSVVHLSEPEAAAIHYATQARVAPGSAVAVYDLGGGTFDAAVVRRAADGSFELLGRPDGIEHLGGIDFDAAVMRHVDQAVGGAVSRLDPAQPDDLTAAARLRIECVEAKEVLSSDTEASIPVVLPTMRTTVRLTRSELEDMVRPALVETIAALRRSLEAAGVQPEDLQSVLLVGGSSRIPLVSQLVSAELGRPVAVDAHPKHAVALGAAVAAAQHAGAGDALTVLDAPDEAVAEPAPARPAWTAAPTADADGDGVGGGRRPSPAVLAGAIGLVLVLVAAFVLTRGGGDGEDASATTTTVDGEPAPDPIVGVPPVEDRGDAWIFPSSVGGLDVQGIVGVDLASGEVLARANTNGTPAIATPLLTDDAVWSASAGSPVVLERFSRDDGSLLATVELPVDGPVDFIGVIRTAEHLWVAVEQNSFGNQPTGRIFRIQEETAQVNLTLELPSGVRVDTLTTDGERVWVATGIVAADLGIITVEDEAASEPIPVAGPAAIDELAFSDGSLWIVGDGVLFEVDPDGFRVEQTVSLGVDDISGTSALLLTEDAVSVVGEGPGGEAVLVTVDRSSGDVSEAELGPAVAEDLFGGATAGVDAEGRRWVYGSGNSTEDDPAELWRVDADGDAEVLELPPQPGGGGELAFADGRVAIADLEGGGRLTAPLVRVVDGDDLELVETVRADLYPLVLTRAGDELVLTDLERSEVSVVAGSEVAATHEVDRPLWPGIGVGDEAWTLTTAGIEIVDLTDPEAEPELLPLDRRRAPLLTDGNRVVLRTDPWSVFDPATRGLVGELDLNGADFIQASSEPLSFVPELVAFGALWESGAESSFRIDIATGAVAPVAVAAPDFTVGDDEVWATDGDGGVHRLDPATGAILTSATVDGGDSGRVVLAGEGVWYLDATRDVRSLDPATGEELFAVDLPGVPIAAAAATGSLWLSIEGEDLVVRIDPEAEFQDDAVLASVDVGRRPAYLAAHDGAVWVALQGDLAIARIDPDADEVDETIELR